MLKALRQNPYVRLARADKPIGTYLVLWPGYWSLALAAEKLPDPVLLVKFGIGAFIMRSAGCTINDLFDRDFDRRVERTKTRPLASGELTTKQGVMFLGAQLSAALAILLSLNEYAVVVGALSVFPVAFYTLTKRFFNWPQVVLGFTFNWGALLGWAAETGSIDWQVILPLYVGSAAWTLGYDTIYAHQDKNDDRIVGIRSSALTVGDEFAKPFLGATYIYSTACIAGSGFRYAQIYGGLDTTIFSLGMTGMALNLAYQTLYVDINNSEDLAKKFKINQWVGPSVFTGVIIAKII